MYIRVKRNKTTYFIQCDPTETTLDIKQKLHSLIEQPSSNQRLILLATNDILDDSKTLANQKVPLAIAPVLIPQQGHSHPQLRNNEITCFCMGSTALVENDAILALTLRKDDNEFEDVHIARPEDFMSSS